MARFGAAHWRKEWRSVGNDLAAKWRFTAPVVDALKQEHVYRFKGSFKTRYIKHAWTVY